jgi:hypothetical protein
LNPSVFQKKGKELGSSYCTRFVCLSIKNYNQEYIVGNLGFLENNFFLLQIVFWFLLKLGCLMIRPKNTKFQEVSFDTPLETSCFFNNISQILSAGGLGDSIGSTSCEPYIPVRFQWIE